MPHRPHEGPPRPHDESHAADADSTAPKAEDYLSGERILPRRIEPEMTAKIFKRGYRVYEIPITYDGRGYEQGKKITWRDGAKAVWCIVRFAIAD